MKRFNIIKGFKEEVYKILDENSLSPTENIENFIDDTHHTVAVPCLDRDNKKVLLRILITSDKKKNKSFDKEFKLYKIFQEYSKEFNKLPVLVEGDLKNKLKWMTRKYYEGKSLGDFWGFGKKDLNDSLADQLIKYLIKLQSRSQEVCKKIDLNKRKARWFIKIWKKDLDYNPDYIHNKFVLKHFNNEEINKIDKIFKINKKILNKYCNRLIHGDLMPQNIFIDKENNIFFIDWEELHLNNPLFDVSYIFVNAWENKDWRDNFLDIFIKLYPEKNKEELKKLADLNIVLISLRMAEYAYLNLVHKDKRIEEALKQHIKTIKDILKKYKL